MDVRKVLRERLSNRMIFSDEYWTRPRYKHRKHLSIREKRGMINNINDYIRMDDFYSKLAERNSYIRNNQAINDIEVVKLNKKCLELVEDALEKVDWSRYRY